MGNKQNSINLLKTDEKSVFEQILAWILTIGRVLVIVTEGIALLAFVYRFGLDRKLVDLKDDIKPLQIYITQKHAREETFRDIQDRLRIIKKYNVAASETNLLFAKVIENAKGKLVFNAISQDTKTITIDALTRSTSNMSAFINQLKTIPQVKTISIDKVENKPASAQIGFVITIALAQK
ncbi:hypothetical protein BH11PAT1_BH11PAT1_6400 [soil metagenome]